MTNLRFSTAALAAALIGAATVPAAGQNYDHEYQARHGEMAVFHTTGPATKADTHAHDPQGDAFLASVEMPNGETFTEYYKPVNVVHLRVGDDDGRKVSINGGSNITSGQQGKRFIGDFDSSGDRTNPTAADYAAFSERLRETLANNNLNSYIDHSGSNPYFECIIEFDLPLKDNDPEPDDFGELLYFERGADGGNSWITLQAVDADGNALGPALAVSPHETVHTSPPTQITSNSSQYIGAVGVDISRLGVSETKYLKVRKTSTSDAGYARVGVTHEDFNPDFKFMAVITHPEQLAQRVAGYD